MLLQVHACCAVENRCLELSSLEAGVGLLIFQCNSLSAGHPQGEGTLHKDSCLPEKFLERESAETCWSPKLSVEGEFFSPKGKYDTKL